MKYRPISCSLYDQLERFAVGKQSVDLIYRSEAGNQTDELITLKTRILDVFSRNKQEFIRLEGGEEVRLDLIVRADGIDFAR
jgi:Rho-binding antiterminator